MKEKKKISLLKLFMTFFKINAITFGGGYTIVPIIKDVFVSEGYINEDDMLDIVALAQSGPGAMAISASLLTGYKVRGPLGAIVSAIASASPCLIILSVISMFYAEFRSNFYVNAALEGISGVICAVLLLTVINMGKNAYNKYPGFSTMVMIMVFGLGFFAGVRTAPLILLSAILGLSVFTVIERKG